MKNTTRFKLNAYMSVLAEINKIDRVSRRGPMVKYVERPMLGISDNALLSINKVLLSWLTS